MTQIALFPGQGSQALGMGRSFYLDFSYVQELFELASDTLKIDFSQLCFFSQEAELTKTENTQPALFLVCYAGFKVLEKELGFVPGAGAGHSLGEYSALACAEAINLVDALKLVRKRGELMAEAGNKAQVGMMAVLGWEADEVKKVCEQAKGSEFLVPANFNAPGQIVISGDNSALARAEEIFKQKKTRVIRLKVSGAFHSPLMKKASQGLREFLEQINFKPFKFPIVSNLEAKPYPDASAIKEILVKQMVSPVRWQESVIYLSEMKPEFFIEIGPGKVLAGLVKRIVPQAVVYNFSESKDLKELEKVLKNE